MSFFSHLALWFQVPLRDNSAWSVSDCIRVPWPVGDSTVTPPLSQSSAASAPTVNASEEKPEEPQADPGPGQEEAEAPTMAELMQRLADLRAQAPQSTNERPTKDGLE